MPRPRQLRTVRGADPVIVVKRLWRWRPVPGVKGEYFIETTEVGERCDWVTEAGTYVTLKYAVLDMVAQSP